MKKRVRFLVLLLTLVLLGSLFAGCGEDTEEPTGKLIGGDEEEEAENPYKDVDFNGRNFTVHINVNEAGFDTSSKYIISVEELSADCDRCEREVFERDAWMQANLNMGIEYTPYNAPYGSVAESLRLILSSGDSFDLFIDKLYPMANLSLEGHFENIANRYELSYFENYWYNDYMNSLSLDEGNTMFLMAGDIFIDVLRSSNTMFVNMDMLDAHFASEGGSEKFLSDVIDGKWTYDELMKRSKQVYTEGQTVLSTQYGLLLHTVWEPMIPMIIAGGATFAEINQEGKLQPNLNTEKNAKLFEKLHELIYSETCDTCIRNMDNDWGLNPEFGVEATLSDIQNLFVGGHGLFTYGRFASMERLSKSALTFSVIPYPKCEETDPYITASHDTTEIGAIPNNAEETGTILQMLDIMSALTNQSLIKIYYEESLKLKYSANPVVASIVDIIHDNMGSAFALAYNNACNNLLLWNSFYIPLRDGRDFNVNLKSYSSALQSSLNSLTQKWNEIS